MSEKVEIGDQPDNPSRTGSLLRLFAKAVALEERDLSNSTDRLIQAADEIALERGLVSPSRSRRTSPRAIDLNIERFYEGPESSHIGNRIEVEFDTEHRIRHISDDRSKEDDRSEEDDRSKEDNRSRYDGRSKEDEEADEAAAASIAAMDFAPSNSKTMPGLKRGSAGDDFESDVDALIESRRASTMKKAYSQSPRSSAPHKSRTTHVHASQELEKRNNSRDNARYRKRMQERETENSENEHENKDEKEDEKSDTDRLRSQHSSRTQKPKQQMSAVAIHLNKSDELRSNSRKSPSQSLFTSTAQEILFRKMHSHTIGTEVSRKSISSDQSQSQGKSSSRDTLRNSAEKGSHQERIKSIVDRLTAANTSRPNATEIRRDPTLRHTRYDDAKECTFKPQINGQKKENHGNDDRDEEEKDREKDSRNAFIGRQEALERTRRQEQDLAIGKAAYDKLIDKKQCPVCTAKQSYDEVKEKRKECPNCRVEYKRSVTWGEIGNQFFLREKNNAAKKDLRKEIIKQSIIDESNMKEKVIYDREIGKRVVVKEKIDLTVIHSTAETEKEFHERMKLRISERENRLRLLEESNIAATCTFKPMIQGRARRKDSDDDSQNDDDDNTKYSTTNSHFLQRMEDDWDSRRRNAPGKFITKEELSDKLQTSRFHAFK